MERNEIEQGGYAAADAMFTVAWRENLPELEARARRFAEGQRDRAEELLGNTAMKAWLFMRNSPQTITDPCGILFVVMRHVFLDSVRQRNRDREVFDRNRDIDSDAAGFAHDGLSALQQLELDEQLDRVIVAVSKMSREQRRLFAYRFIDDLPYPEIAARLHINQPLARKRVELLRNRLRSAVGD
ncbi:sigma-70 family RNA polymerase sigma factor [Lysobacter sp. BMK333-48F3]|uniref:RNA polymerase sigma factor n=1 Tax=Lysobacter sp. BMK333-48F3 TaxID=2867962 RepID=UPI001C8B8238|nr:sigma-70 family RNA polymerase sigma factor [Lysobacter sp. BMK333-48F3]MBX9401577.1 sigma-70 family RNA polymerase sigma factor [Lysobacter sp. BMK333-48F3]